MKYFALAHQFHVPIARYGKPAVWKLCYRASRDGSRPADFHRQCDKKGTTMTVIRTINGCVFGGCTPCDWTPTESFKFDPSSFLFSLKSSSNHQPIKLGHTGKLDQQSIYASAANGPIFGGGHDGGGHDILVKFASPSSSNSNLGHSFALPTGYAYNGNAREFLAGQGSVTVTEIEVYYLSK